MIQNAECGLQIGEQGAGTVYELPLQVEEETG